ncbi:MAG: amidohydrolase family protein, partial [Patescibacteria group bacterium]
MYSLLIKNALVVDGSGNVPQILDVALQGDEIANIAPAITSSAQNVIDAKGKVLAPGFIDPQNHSDSYWQLFDNPSLDSLITQGYTTILTGNCGASLAPLLSSEALLSVQKWHNLEATNINWQSYSEYLDVLSEKKFACNVAGLVGYSTLRRAIVGDQIRSLEKNEIAALKLVLEESLKNGAFGLSSGLSYAHEIIISELELYELAKILKAKDALFSVHLRSEGGELVEAIDEALDIAKNTGVNLKVSHLKVRNELN